MPRFLKDAFAKIFVYFPSMCIPGMKKEEEEEKEV